MTAWFESKVVIGTGAEAGIGAATMSGFHAVQAGVKPLTPPPTKRATRRPDLHFVH